MGFSGELGVPACDSGQFGVSQSPRLHRGWGSKVQGSVGPVEGGGWGRGEAPCCGEAPGIRGSFWIQTPSSGTRRGRVRPLLPSLLCRPPRPPPAAPAAWSRLRMKSSLEGQLSSSPGQCPALQCNGPGFESDSCHVEGCFGAVVSLCLCLGFHLEVSLEHSRSKYDK